jgi:hypothetical protein
LNPTSREKRARCGAPLYVVRQKLEGNNYD